MFIHKRICEEIFQNIQKTKKLHPRIQKIKEGELMWIEDENIKCSDALDQQSNFFHKNSKAQKLPPMNSKSKLECSSKLIMKTKNVQIH